MKRILSILVENEPGALSRIVGLFSQRNYNIDTLSVAPTEDKSLSRLTLTTQGKAEAVEQITKQLHKLIDVVKVSELTERDHLEREIMLIKIRTTNSTREDIKRNTDIFRAQIVDATHSEYTIQISGKKEKLDAFIDLIGLSQILDIARSGSIGIARGKKTWS